MRETLIERIIVSRVALDSTYLDLLQMWKSHKIAGVHSFGLKISNEVKFNLPFNKRKDSVNNNKSTRVLKPHGVQLPITKYAYHSLVYFFRYSLLTITFIPSWPILPARDCPLWYRARIRLTKLVIFFHFYSSICWKLSTWSVQAPVGWIMNNSL